MLHQLGVPVDERLALGAIGDEVFHLRLRFDVGGESGAAGAHHAALTQTVAEHKLEDSRGGKARGMPSLPAAGPRGRCCGSLKIPL